MVVKSFLLKFYQVFNLFLKILILDSLVTTAQVLGSWLVLTMTQATGPPHLNVHALRLIYKVLGFPSSMSSRLVTVSSIWLRAILWSLHIWVVTPLPSWIHPFASWKPSTCHQISRVDYVTSFSGWATFAECHNLLSRLTLLKIDPQKSAIPFELFYKKSLFHRYNVRILWSFTSFFVFQFDFTMQLSLLIKYSLCSSFYWH